MQLNLSGEIPIYLQIAQSIENDIVRGVFPEETQIPSTTEVSLTYKINPATVAKGFNLLVDDGLIYKKRGVGMFVSPGAKERLLERRRTEFYEKYIRSLLEEAERLGIRREDLIDMLERGNDQ